MHLIVLSPECVSCVIITGVRRNLNDVASF